MSDIKIIKVNKNIADEIEKILLGDYFGWYYNYSTSFDNNDIKNNPDTFQFTHCFYDEKDNSKSHAFDSSLKLFASTKLKCKNFFRIKANFTTPSLKLKGKHQYIHTDVTNKDMSTFLYYVNDSDGDTIFFNKNKKEIKRVKPKKGTGVLFKSNTLHSGSNPINSDKRMVINYIFYE